MLVALAVTCSACGGDDGQGDDTSTTNVDTSGGPTTDGTQTETSTSATSTTTTETSTSDSGSDVTTDATTATTTGADSGSTGQTGTDYVPCDPENPCADDSICWTDGDTANVCGAPCTRATDCPTPSNGEPVCVEDTQDPGSSYCIIPCADEGDCPDGMQCVSLGNSSYCFWGP